MVSESVLASEKLTYRIDEVVKVTGLGRTSIYELMTSGVLPSLKVGARRLIMKDDLVAFLESCRQA